MNLSGLSELGTEVVKVFLLPKVQFVSERLETCMNSSNADKIAAEHIKALIVVS
jgi:transcription initiation factor TFIID subunit 6